jgi:hypothetical protein
VEAAGLGCAIDDGAALASPLGAAGDGLHGIVLGSPVWRGRRVGAGVTRGTTAVV